MVARIGADTDMRGWVSCLVRPLTDHLADLGNPTWYARFAAQAMTDPAYHGFVVKDALSSSSLVQVVDGINRCLPNLALDSRFDRNIMARNLLMHSCADRERAMAKGATVASRTSWQAAGSGPDRRDRWHVVGTRHPGRRRGRSVRVTVDQDKCVSSGMCVMNAAEVFDQSDDDGVVVLLARGTGARVRRRDPQGRGRLPSPGHPHRRMTEY